MALKLTVYPLPYFIQTAQIFKLALKLKFCVYIGVIGPLRIHAVVTSLKSIVEDFKSVVILKNFIRISFGLADNSYNFCTVSHETLSENNLIRISTDSVISIIPKNSINNIPITHPKSYSHFLINSPLIFGIVTKIGITFSKVTPNSKTGSFHISNVDIVVREGTLPLR
ncbi:hypothetical protein HZS_5744 [Henneguya salminicola]|nr:hypothetical protein HZS_5744 [Henneguya salminicola]